MEKYQPPITISEEILNMTAEITQLIGGINYSQKEKSNPRLRRDGRIRTIHSSLAIENNTLSLSQVTAIINGKRVLGKMHEIKEVQNAFEVYEIISSYDPYDINHMLSAHKIMMSELVEECGKFRSGGVGVFNGERLLHMAPPAQFVYSQICDLLEWVKISKLHPLVKSCVFHYEFEYIHPFADGNGRIGRMWQTLLLSQYQKLFLYLPIESLIKSRQKEYYKTLSISDGTGDCVHFVEFMLEAILDALKQLNSEDRLDENIKKVLLAVGDEILPAKEIMQRLNLSHPATFRKNYLNPAIEIGVIALTNPESPRSKNQKYYKI